MSDSNPAVDHQAVRSVPLTDEDGNEYVIEQQNAGAGGTEGGGEWADPGTPPRSPAPGSADG
ncbi:MAG: hypothetical protein ACT4OS_10525 [Acidimicrobiales bacterium]